jgi:hypothetical protein
MTAIQRAINFLGLDRRCSGFCLKCDLSIQRRFDSASEERREGFVEALALFDREDFGDPQPIVGLVTLLNHSEFEQFIARMAERNPFESSLAWQIIRLAAEDNPQWFIKRGTAPFQRQFHHHPAIAPSLIEATIQSGSEAEDALRLLDYFSPIAPNHPVLMQALPLWHAARSRQEAERQAESLRRQELRRLEEEQLKARWAAREVKFRDIESGGRTAIICAVLAAPSLSSWDCSERWAELIEAELDTLPRETLGLLARKFSRTSRPHLWRSLVSKIHLLISRANSKERSELLLNLSCRSLPEKLLAACESRWALTYFPETWAEQIIHDTSEISVELRTRLLSKLMRLNRRTSWRAVRQLLLRSL